MVFGQKPLHVSDSMLLKQRRASAAASRVLCCGADLDLSLMMVDGASQGCADPDFEAHVGALHMWALAVWEDRTPRPMLKWLIDDACGRLSPLGLSSTGFLLLLSWPLREGCGGMSPLRLNGRLMLVLTLICVLIRLPL